MNASEDAGKRQYLAFSVAGSDYGVGILRVKEILQYESITPIPSTPPSVRGVINLRGTAVPVIDLAVRLGLRETPVTKRTCIVVVTASVDGPSTVVGVIADTVSEVLELGPGDIEPPPGFGTRIKADYLVGMGKVGKGFVLLVDLDRVLSAGELELVAQAGKDDPPAPAPPGDAPADRPSTASAADPDASPA